MPYIKFESKEERDKAWNIWFPLQGESRVKGLVVLISDPNLGIINFFTKEPYIEAFDKAGIKYSIISKEQVTSEYIYYLKERAKSLVNDHPDLTDYL